MNEPTAPSSWTHRTSSRHARCTSCTGSIATHLSWSGLYAQNSWIQLLYAWQMARESCGSILSRPSKARPAVGYSTAMSTPSISMPITWATGSYSRSTAKSSRPVSKSRDPDKGCVLCGPLFRTRFRYCWRSTSEVGMPSMTVRPAAPRVGRPSAPTGTLTRSLNCGSRYRSKRSGGSMMCMSLSTNLNPSFMALSLFALRPSAIGVRRLFDGFPEDRVVTGKDTTAHEPRDRLQLLERVKRQRRVPDHAGHALFVRVFLPVAGVAREDDRARRGQLDQQGLVARRVAVRSQHRHAREQLCIAVQQTPTVARQIEVLPVIERLEEGGRVVGIGILVLLDDQLGLGEEHGAPGVVEVKV